MQIGIRLRLLARLSVATVLGALIAPVVTSADLSGESVHGTMRPCERLGELTKYSAVARQKFEANTILTKEYSFWEIPFLGPVCTSSERHHLGDIEYLVATRPVGTAVRIQRQAEDEIAIFSGIFTGGGEVSFKNRPHPPNIGRTDTTGTHPAVAECNTLRANLPQLSAELASLPPTHQVGSVHVRAGEVFTIDARGTDRPVIEFDDLVLRGSPDRRRSGRSCRNNAGGQLLILTDDVGPGGVIRDVELVLNVRGRVDLGHCYQILSNLSVLNVIGEGRGVRARMPDGLGFFGVILAPERTVRIGSTLQGALTYVGSVFANQISTVGEIYMGLFCFDPEWADRSIFDD